MSDDELVIKPKQPSLVAEPVTYNLSWDYIEPRNQICHVGAPWHPIGTPCPCWWHRFLRFVTRGRRDGVLR